jgi:hypothetical protein
MSEVEITTDGSCLGTQVPEAGRAPFGAVSMSGSCKVLWQTRPTIGWN